MPRETHRYTPVPVYLCMPTRERRYNMDDDARNATIARPRIGIATDTARPPTRGIVLETDSSSVEKGREGGGVYPFLQTTGEYVRENVWNSSDARSKSSKINIFGGAWRNKRKERAVSRPCAGLGCSRAKGGKKKGAHSLRDILRSSRILLHRYFLIAPG